jgi:RND family efflux transporter MFP subunit
MDLEWKQRIILVLVAACCCTGFLAACGSQQPPAASASSNKARAITVRAAPAFSGSISVTTTFSAIVEAEDLVDVVPLGTGRVEGLTVDVGSEVQKGQVIAELSGGSLEAQLREAEAKLRRARSDLALTQAMVKPNRIKAQAELEAARARLYQLLNPSESELRVAESEVAKERINLNSAKTKLDQILDPIAADLADAKAEVTESLSELSAAQAKVNQAILDEQGVTSGGLTLLWKMVLTARQGLENSTLILYHPFLSLELTPELKAAAQQALTDKQEILSGLLAEINSEFVIPKGVRSALWVEAEAQAALDASRTRLDQLTESDPHTIALAHQEVEAAQAELDAALARLNLIKNPNQADLSTAETKVFVAEQTLALYHTPLSQHEIEAARSDVDEAQAEVEQVKQLLKELKVVAPIDGLVTRRWLAQGAVATSQTPVVTLASRKVVVSLRVEETRIASLQPGQRVTLTSPALPGRELELQIDWIAPAGDEKAHAFLLRLRPVEGATELKPGMSGQVSIVTRREGVTLVPRQAVLQEDGQATLFVIQDNKAHLRKVEVGLVDAENMEIHSGIQAGEQVILSGQALLSDGDEVTLESRSPKKRSR